MDELFNFLQRRFYDFAPEGPPRMGAYGFVVVMRATRPDVGPSRFALKTVGPQALTRTDADVIRTNFEREMRVWLRLPSHRSVLPALGLEFIAAPRHLAHLWPILPVVRMPFCDGSLQEWIEDTDSFGTDDRLLAIAQTCSGLAWLYEHGITGHGDLKPDNILTTDLRSQFSLSDTAQFPSLVHPWQIRISDLGWANAWMGTGGRAARGWRPYAAPERQRGEFVPEKSDVFALGVISAELLTGRHPTGLRSEEVAKWSDRKWAKWVEEGQRHLLGVDDGLQDILKGALSVDPTERPSCAQFQEAVLQALTAPLSEQAAKILTLWTEERRNAPGNRAAVQAAWAARQVAALDRQNLSREIDALRCLRRDLGSEASAEESLDFFEVSLALTDLLTARGDAREACAVAASVVRYSIRRFDDLDLRSAKGWSHRKGSDDLMGFEPWEAQWSYATTALEQLRKVGADGNLLAMLETELEDKRRVHDEPVELFLSRLLKT